MQKDCQTIYPHPSWKGEKLGAVTAAWYQREITVPVEWTGRRIVLHAQYVHSFATVLVDGQKMGELRYPWGDGSYHGVSSGRAACLEHVCGRHALEGRHAFLPRHRLRPPGQGRGGVSPWVMRRCLSAEYASWSPHQRREGGYIRAPAIDQRRRVLEGLADDGNYVLRARVAEGRDTVREFTSEPFQQNQLQNGRITVTESWKPEKLWDVHTPQNMYDLHLTLCDVRGEVLDAGLPKRFGFREFWIEGRDFYLNGTRIFLSSVPLDNASGRRGMVHLRRGAARACSGLRVSGSISSTRTTTAASRARI